MNYIFYLKIIYIIVVLLFYVSLLIALASDYIYVINLGAGALSMGVFLFIARIIAYGGIEYHYNYGTTTQLYEVVAPLVVCGVGIGVFVIRIIIAIKKDIKPNMRKKYIVVDNDGFVEKIKDLRKSGVNVVYDIIYGKKHKYECTSLTFFNVTYKEACLYSETLKEKKRDYRELGKNIIILGVVAVVDCSIIDFRFRNDNYIRVLDWVEGLLFF